ncbi:MAG: lytic transglycosylase [Piscirickettsiaceae bacterium]|nr:MAG: lytic transglycosylase [Piscirickettsiaceae bacterium]
MQYLITNKTQRVFLFFSILFLISCSSQQLRPIEKAKFTETVASTSNDIYTVKERPTKINAINNNQTLWQRLFTLYQFPPVNNKRVQAEINWYSKHPEYIARVQKNAVPYLFYIVNEVEKRGLPGELALLPIVESAFRPFAYSHGRAAGLWQFIPATGKAFGLKQTWWYDGRRDVTASTDAALQYLTKLSTRFDDWFLGLAAYNAGGGNISKAIKYNKKRGKNTDYWALKLRKETLQYVPKLIAISHILAHAEQYNIDLLPIPNEPYFQKINTQKQIDLARASALANIDITDLYKLNPAFNQWATDPAGPHYLLVPSVKAEQFRQQLAALPDNQRLKWQRHKIKQGETLGHISNKYHTPIALIKQANQIHNHSIRAGKYLLIPTPSFDNSLYSSSVPMRKKAIVSAQRKGQKRQYRVSKGDSLWTISQQHKVTVRQLAKWNAMAPRDTLKVGQQLNIWQRQRSNSRSTTLSPASKNQSINYTVRQGDSLYLISKRFKVSINDLKRWNTLNRKYLKPGQRLKIIVDVTRT